MLKIDTNSPFFIDMTAQFAHFFAGMALVETLTAYGHPYIGMIGFTSYAGIKEFVIDKYLEGQPFSDNLKDFLFYLAGSVVGLRLGLF
jgi:hypothetical protein